MTIVLTAHNEYGYLKNTLSSIQNQNFAYIEIIIIYNYSEEERFTLIKRLMIEDPRIRCFQNNQNRGALYTKAKGVLNTKGKYTMIIDIDDIYSREDVFDFVSLYKEAEKHNLDILGFAFIQVIYNNEFHKDNYYDISIIYQQDYMIEL